MTTGSPSLERVGIVGAGATGGYLAAALTDAGYHVTLLARGRSADVIRERGLIVHGLESHTFTAQPAEIVEPGDPVTPADVTLFCVKAYDTGTAVRAIGGLVGDNGAILCLQNGVANEDVLAGAYGPHRVMSGALYIGAERLEPGVVKRATPARIVFGPYDRATASASAPFATELRDMFRSAGISCDIDDDVHQAKWQKFVFNCGLNSLTALTRQRLGTIRQTASGRALYTALISEAIEAAQASGAPLPEDALARAESTADHMDISSSMAEDLEAGRPLEIAAFTGHVLRLAEEHHTDASVTQVVHSLLATMDHGQ